MARQTPNRALIPLLLLISFFGGDLLAKDVVLHSTQLPIASSEIESVGMFIDADDNTFIIVRGHGSQRLYRNDKLVDLKPYSSALGAVLKDGHLRWYDWQDTNIHVCTLGNKGEVKLLATLGIEGTVIQHSAPGTGVNVLPVGEDDRSCCLLAARWVFPVSPVELLFDFASGGHGVYYVKPILIELRNGKPAERRELAYGGKADESYYINRVTPSGDVVHLLGLRQQEKRAWGPREVKFTPVTLQHTAYHLKKKKVTQTDPIYAETPRGERVGAMWHRYDYGDFSMDAAGDDVFVAFSWEKLSHPTNQSGEQRVESNILYWESCGGRTSKAEKVADGFLPIVKADPLGNVRLLCVNQNSNVTHRVKRNGVWEEEKVLFNGVDAKPYFDTIAGAFDKNNRLHVVYPSTGSLVHAIVNPD